MRTFLFLLVFVSAISSCQSQREKTYEATALGQVETRLEEASALTASISNPGLFWTLNDSGNPPEVFLIDGKAQTRLVCKLSQLRNRDWEDVAVGAGPVAGKSYVYVADIGDNLSQYTNKYIYRFEEPKAEGMQEINITRFDTLILHLPDGPRDSETILIDPLTHDLFLISKREDSVRLYMSSWPLPKDVFLKRVGTLPLTYITSGSISADGLEVLLKDYEQVYHWKRKPGQSIPELMTTVAEIWPYNREPQGEAIGWSADGKGYYTLSEGSTINPGVLYRYNRP